MGGPAGVADAHRAGQLFPLVQDALQHGQPPLGLYHMEAALVVHRHPGGVIPPVFQLAQALQQHGRRLFLSDISHDSTHINHRLRKSFSHYMPQTTFPPPKEGGNCGQVQTPVHILDRRRPAPESSLNVQGISGLGVLLGGCFQPGLGLPVGLGVNHGGIV